MNLTNTQFVFEGKTKRILYGGMALGVLCLVLSFLNDDEYHTRFWTNFLHNSVYFTGIALMAMFFMAAQITAFAGWNTVIRRILEGTSQFMWVGIILMGIIAAGVWLHFHHLYHWNDPNVNVTDPAAPHYDRIIAGKKGFLNPVFFTIATVGFLALWYFWARNVRKLSIAQDTEETASFDYYKKIRRWSASFLPIAGFLSPVLLWQAVMSLDPHWYSTMFAWYSTASMWLGSISFTVLIIIYLKSKGYLEYVTHDHLHDVGKYLFGISVFWTYLWFDQFMLIWYANNGEETIYFKERMNHYPVLFWGNLLMNFVAPFLILMRNDTKRKFGTMFFVALIVFFGHWWDFFYMIKPGARIAAFEAKELAEGGHETSHSAAPISGAQHEETATTAEQPAETHSEDPAAAHSDADTAHSEEAAAQTESAADHGTPAAEAATAAAGHGDEGGHGGDAHGGSHAEAAEPNSFRLGFTVPGLEEIGVMIGFLSLFLFFLFGQLERVSLIPWKDPFLEESLHHETGALIESEQVEGGGHH
ncbi:MAG: hypothetical protein EPGJADBJ_01702 [Saprospiraceae bacterium]|nr:hypothetical protein [Saprospiraceae bacterium]